MTKLIYILIALGLLVGAGFGARELAMRQGWLGNEAVGKKEVAIVSPSWAGLPLGLTTYAVSVRTTPNVRKLVIELHEYGKWTKLAWPAYEKETAKYTVSDYKFGDVRWNGVVGPVKGELRASGKVTRHRLVVKATFADGTTQEVERLVHYQFAAPSQKI